ncbi:MBL fold metallo-hydrolase [Ectobacillus sp. sgz5001026]|uniref:MBL fold metallo-hydrolase n=1 Tax=Ectobacillus sp. sgz5001026 TaxID=3242473 RepID=UPI0036D339CC
MKWTQMPLGPIQTNAYIVYNDQHECIIIDPGAEGEKLLAYLDENELKPQAILLTHAHFDHIGAVDEVRRVYTIPVYVHKNEQDWLVNPSLNRSLQFTMSEDIIVQPADCIIEKEGPLTVGSFSFEVYETPGHTPGSVSYYLSEAGLVCSGDALFQMSIGRTDLPEGNMIQLLTAIEEKLFLLPADTKVLCGHGPVTTIGAEKENNPFLS